MKFTPRNVRSRLTLWYVLVLATLLALYAGVACLFLFLSLREDFDQNLLQDVETVEGMLTKEPNGGVSLHSSHPDATEPRVGHFSSKCGRLRERCCIEVHLCKIRR